MLIEKISRIKEVNLGGKVKAPKNEPLKAKT